MKFTANYKDGRRDTALHVANTIIEHIDSAIIRERESSATEMATIYETNKKDAEIAQQKMPAEICTRMNEALSGDDNESGMFVTFWLGLLDLKSGHLDFCNAGHNPPIIGGGENHADFLEMIPNAPIGLWPGMEYEGEEIDTIKGRPLFVYTDGLNEAENLQQEQFGDDRLLDILRTTHFDTAQQVIDVLKNEVEQHRDGAEPNDDLTMMCIFYETQPVTL